MEAGHGERPIIGHPVDNDGGIGRENELPVAAAPPRPVPQDHPQHQPPVAQPQQLPPNFLSQDEQIHYPGDPQRMVLTNDETRWALAIKAAASNIPELDLISDYKYAQLAIIERDNVEGAIAAATALQAIREEYKFIDSCEEGVRSLRKVVEYNPRKFLNFSFSETEQKHVFVHDVCQRVSQEENIETYMAGAYYLFQTVTMDFESIRRGIIVLIECQGYDWNQKRSWKLAQKMFMELIYYYPVKGEFRHYHNGLVFNIFASMLKKLLPTRLCNSFHTGCQLDARLDELFLVPTPEAANERIMERLKAALELRYSNEQSFSLPRI